MTPLRTIRRRVAPTALALSTLLVVAACGGSGGSASGGASSGSGSNTLADYAKTPASDVKDGGTVRLPVSTFGPDWNLNSNNGNSSDTQAMLYPVDTAGCWTAAENGTPVLNRDFCTSVKDDVSGGKQTITIDVNPKATWNDGTPIDVDTFVNQWKIFNDPAYESVITKPYDDIANVTAGTSDKQVVITTKQVYEPYQDFFSGLVSQEVSTPDIFNKGFVDDPHPEWMAGPFTIKQLDNSAKTLVEVPNPKWWGTRPKLSQIVWTQYEDSASIPAFKNGQLDAVGVSTSTRLAQVEGVQGIDIRKGKTVGIFGFIMNTKSPDVSDVAVRKAIYQALDRKALSAVEFQGTGYSEQPPGSWMLMSVSEGYQDNYPVKDSDAAGAAATLQAAGYAKDSKGIFAKGGKEVAVPITNYGDDPVTLAFIKAAVQQLGKAGFAATIDQHSAQDFNKVFTSGDYAISFSGYGMGGYVDTQPEQYYNSTGDSNYTHCGTAAIDQRISTLNQQTDATTLTKDANGIEADWQKACYAFLPILNGPQFTAVKSDLVNYGSSLFLTPDWTVIGFKA